LNLSSHHHCPVKYGFNPDKPPPRIEGGVFAPSFDERLWLFTRYWEPPAEISVRATLMILHGTVDHSGVYAELAKNLNQKGIAVFAMDMRGWGLSDGESMYFHDVKVFVQDVNACYQQIHEYNPRYASVGSRFLLGKSLGGTVTAFTVASYPNHFTGLLGLAGAYELDPMMMPGQIVLTILKQLARVAPKLPIKPLFDPSLIVSDAGALQRWQDDPLCCKDRIRLGYIVEVLRCCKALTDDSIVSAIDIPMLMMIGTADHVVTLSGHKLMIEKCCSKDATLKLYKGGYHNLLQEPGLKLQVISDIQAWILARSM